MMKLEATIQRQSMNQDEAKLICEIIEFTLQDAGYKTGNIILRRIK